MANKRRTDPWHLLASLAASQHGVVSREQLRAYGVSDRAIAHAARSGRIHRVFRGVYALGVPLLAWRGRLLAATLACGEGAVVSHRSAAALLGLLDKAPVVVDVIAPGSRGRKIAGIRPHLVPAPGPHELESVSGIPCTGASRTLVDLAGVVGDWTLRSAFERTAQKGLLDITAIEAAAGRGRRGSSSLLGLLEEWRRAAPVSRRSRLKSPLEARVLPLLVQHRLPPPLANAPVEIANGRIEVDFLWPSHRLVVEADSRDFHGTEVAFERDRWRDRELLRAGYTSLRVTSRQAENEPGAVASTIAAFLTRAPDLLTRAGAPPDGSPVS